MTLQTAAYNILVDTHPSIEAMRAYFELYKYGTMPPLQFFAHLEQAVVCWAAERNITAAGGATVASQWCKTIEELGETVAALVRGKDGEAEDGIGDILVTLIIQRNLLGLPQFSATLASSNLHTSYAPPKQAPNRDALHNAIDLLAMHITSYRSYESTEIRTSNMLYSLTRLASYIGCSLHECLYSSVLEILPRKGRMVDGVFIKEEPAG